MNAKILLAIPRIMSKQLQDIYPPIGLAYIHAALLKANYDVDVINLNFHTMDELKKILFEKDVSYVLSGGTSYDYLALKELFSYAKASKPDIITIGGGVGYTAEPIVFSEMTNVDYAVLGEGEVADIELIDHLQKSEPVENLHGIVYKDRNGIYRKALEPIPIEDIDSIPFPNYDGFEVEKYFDNQKNHGFPRHFSDVDDPRVMLLMNSRSCPYHCSFCLHPIGSRYRERSLDLVFEEIESCISKYRINGIFFADELFARDQERVREFCERIKPLNLRWFVELRVDVVSYELIIMLKEAGCVSVLLGLESCSDDILRDMHKGISTTQIIEAVDIMDRSKMRMEGHLIFGTPLENDDSYKECFEFWRKYKCVGVDIVWLFLYPGTHYYKLACEKGIIKDRKQFIIDRMPHLNVTSMDRHKYEKYARISSLTLVDEDHYGDIEKKTIHGNSCDLSLICPRCGGRFVHRNIPVVDVENSTSRLSLEIPCECCGRYSYYPIRNKENFYFSIIKKQIESNREIGYSMEKKLLSENVNKIGLIGDERLMELVSKEFNEVHILFKQVIDGLRKINTSEAYEDCEALIIVNPIRFNKIKKSMLKIGFNKRVISLNNLLFDFEYHTEN